MPRGPPREDCRRKMQEIHRVDGHPGERLHQNGVLNTQGPRICLGGPLGKTAGGKCKNSTDYKGTLGKDSIGMVF